MTDTLPRKDSDGSIDFEEIWPAQHADCIRVGGEDWYDFDAFMKALYNAAIDDAADMADKNNLTVPSLAHGKTPFSDAIKELKQ